MAEIERRNLETLGRHGDCQQLIPNRLTSAAVARRASLICRKEQTLTKREGLEVNFQMRDAYAPHPVSSTAKLACANLWKVYGPRVGYYFDTKGYIIDPQMLAKRMRDEKHIPAVANVSLDIPEGEIFVIMGLSGSGKSTVLRCLARLLDLSHGQVVLDGQDISKLSERDLIDVRRHKIGMVFQHFGLMPHLTVIDNVAFPLKVQGKPKQERLARAHEMIELVGLNGREDAYPRQLSGGQQQRVGIARSLAVGPEVWFLDEPFSALDPLIRRQMQDEFLRLQKQLKKTIVFVTHDFLEAMRLADRVCVMKDGFVVQIGTPEELVSRPANDYVRSFVSDAPLAKVLRVGAIMKRHTGGEQPGASQATVSASAKLEDAMTLFRDESSLLNVCDDDGRAIGSISALQVVQALTVKARTTP
jgi:glycine betaine/proline transport system ATP-binding protein